MTLHKLRKALMQGRFFYVGRLSHFALWRINGSAPRQIHFTPTQLWMVVYLLYHKQFYLRLLLR